MSKFGPPAGIERRSSGFIQPTFTPREPGQPFKRASVALAVVATLAGLGAGIAHLSSLDWETLIRGEGYVPWRTSEAHAVADCRQYGKHVVLYTVDRTHPDNERFQSEVLSDPRVQRLSAGLIWYRRDKRPSELEDEAPEDGGGPRAPTVAIMAWDLDTVVAGPTDGSKVTVAQFLALMEQALGADGDVADQVDPSF